MNTDFSRFTEKSRQVVTASHKLARQCGFSAIEPQILVVAIMQSDRDMLPFMLNHMQVDKIAFFSALSDTMQQLPHLEQGTPTSIDFSPTTNQVFSTAFGLAERANSSVVALEYIFWALFEVNSPVREVMKRFGINSNKLSDAVSVFRTGNTTVSNDAQQNSQSRRSQSSLPNLRKCGRDLVRMAQEGEIEPVIGRDKEVRRLLQILSRKTKNNPVLVGEPGTGKTAIVEGLAHRLSQGDVPEDLREIKLFSLDFAAMVAGAGAQGEFEERLKKVIEEVKTDPMIVLFIDEIHLLMSDVGGIDAANILKPEMARGQIKIIGATTYDEYKKYIETDKAFERRFQKVVVEEPDVDSAITIMRGIKQRFENHHGIKILDEAIVAAVRLSSRYIADRFLPDKAIDLLDEAATMRLNISSAPVELEVLKRTLRSKEIERESLKQDGADSNTLATLDREIAELREKENTMNARWRNERTCMEQLRAMNEELVRLNTNREMAESQGRYRESVEIKNGIDALRGRIEVLSNEIENNNSAMLKVALDETDIMRVVTDWTGIPMTNMTQEETAKLQNIESSLDGTVIGQEKAITAVANVIRRNRMGLSEASKPIGSFLFLGTTGTGKTELCKALAEFLFDSRDMMVRIDMSEYQLEHSVARLFGAPPGYVGYDQGGQLTEAVRRKPYSVVLFDELEKAHSKVLETLLQVFDDGRMTDGQGRVVDFKNTIIIMTSNMGQDVILERLVGVEPEQSLVEEVSEKVIDRLKSRVAPEFINRIDEVVMFLPLTRDDIQKIVELQLRKLVKKLEGNDITLHFDPAVIDFLAMVGYRPEYGGRPVKRAVNDHIINGLSLAMLNGEVDKTRSIRAYIGDTGVKFVNE